MERNKVKFSDGFTAEYYFSNDDAIQDKKIFLPYLHDKTEVYILIEGRSSFVVGDKTYSLSPCDALVIPPFTLHHCILPEPSVHKHFCLWLGGANDAFNEVLQNRDFPVYLPAGENTENLKKVCGYFKREYDNTDKLGLITHIAELLYLFKKSANAVNVHAEERKNDIIPAVLQKVLTDIKENFAEIYTVYELAERNYISPSTLTRLFKKYLQTTPKEYLEAQKLVMAKIYLGGGCNVKEACEKAGFPNCSNFIRTFKRKYSMTPAKYRSSYERD